MIMRYRNRKTGEIIDVPSKLGGNWERIGGEPVKAPAVVPDAVIEEEKPKKTRRKTKKD